MNLDRVLNIAGAIVTVALVTTIVARPNSVRVIQSIGNAFTGAISSALGRGVDLG